MDASPGRIRTTHGGRLGGSAELKARRERLRSGQSADEQAYFSQVQLDMREVVQRQIDCGLDVIGDGELGKPGRTAYFQRRFSGVTARVPAPNEPVMLSQATNERRSDEFKEFFASFGRKTDPERLFCSGPFTFRGQEAVERDIALFRAAVEGMPAREQFMCVLAPGWIEHYLWNEHYDSDEAFLYAIAEAVKPEYKAIVDAGFILQLDDPALPDTYDMISPLPSVEDYRTFAKVRVEATNYALAGLPEDRVRYHICWGSWHGPHTHDLPLRDIVDLLLEIRAQAYLVEAANPRHEHEWKVWRDVKLPADKILIPGLVGHATNVVEHPELVAERIVRYAEVVGRERIIAGTDCGMAERVHPEIGWAKLRALVEGAALASTELFGAKAISLA